MKPRTWIVTLQVQYGSDADSMIDVRYGIEALDRETALVRAGARLVKKMRGALIVSAFVEEERGNDTRTYRI